MIYHEWLEEGKRSVVKKAITAFKNKELPSSSHLYITFRTHFSGVHMNDHLRTQYPEEMTVMLNDMFWDLQVHDDFWSVSLLFDDKKEVLKIPYKALVNFIDPAAEFALQFNWEDQVLKNKQAHNVIFLDRFRPQNP